jgi:hypothetical protein
MHKFSYRWMKKYNRCEWLVAQLHQTCDSTPVVLLTSRGTVHFRIDFMIF